MLTFTLTLARPIRENPFVLIDDRLLFSLLYDESTLEGGDAST